MKDDPLRLIDESVTSELIISNIYSLFYNTYNEHEEFWWQMSLEEKNHASLLKSGKLYFENLGRFPEGLVSNNLEALKETNELLRSLLETLKKNPPTVQDAFNIAFQLENLIGEKQFQLYMDNKDDNSQMARIFKELNQNDKDHLNKIVTYMANNNIPEQAVALNQFVEDQV